MNASEKVTERLNLAHQTIRKELKKKKDKKAFLFILQTSQFIGTNSIKQMVSATQNLRQTII
jgi:hypothetical protein